MRQAWTAALTLVLAVLTAGGAQADTLYVPTIHALQRDGAYKSYPLKGAEGGVRYTECEKRAKRWENENAAAIRTAEKTLGTKGEFGAIRLTCEAK